MPEQTPAAYGEAREDERLEERRAMVRTVASQVRETASYTGCQSLSPRVAEALLRVPRHAFVPPERRDAAYADAALPIDQGQTISQPTIVAIMTELADVGEDDRVLEIGTGCGYQTAVLCELADRVVSVERIRELAEGAAERLARLGYRNAEVRVGDGSRGCPDAAPYAAILVTAAADEMPRPLVEQLAPGARLVLPVGHELVVVSKDAGGAVSRRSTIPVAFVPLLRDD